MTASNRHKTTIGQGLAALLVFVSAAGLACLGILHGEKITYAQFTNPLFSGILWHVSVTGSVLVTFLGIFVALALVLGMISSIATAQLFGLTEYSLAGSGGLVGTFLAIGTSLFARDASTQILGWPLPDGSVESVAALAAVALPIGFTFYKLWRPGSSTIAALSGPDRQEPPDPEIVKQRRIRWSDDVDPTAPPSPTPAGQTTCTDQSANPNDSRGSMKLDELEYRWVKETDVSMDEIGGMKTLKEELQRDIIKPLTSGREKANALNIPLPNIVFHGPPGTGKTYMAQALATELGLPFAQLSGADVQSKWINESAQKINTLFEEAKMVADSEGGAVVFLDELDAVLKQRNTGGSAHEEDNKVVAEFLNHLQDTSEHNIVFIGATNRLEALDDAGIRSGRIDKKIHVGKPDQEARESILRAQLAERPNSLTDEQIERIAGSLDSEVVAADIRSVVVEAARHSAFSRDDNQITWKDMTEVMEV